MSSAPRNASEAKAKIDFCCLTEGCTGVVDFNLQEIAEEDEELFEEEPYENENEDWNNYEVEDTADGTEGDTNEG